MNYSFIHWHDDILPDTLSPATHLSSWSGRSTPSYRRVKWKWSRCPETARRRPRPRSSPGELRWARTVNLETLWQPAWWSAAGSLATGERREFRAAKTGGFDRYPRVSCGEDMSMLCLFAKTSLLLVSWTAHPLGNTGARERPRPFRTLIIFIKYFPCKNMKSF